jgi:hypothetical protein
MLHMGHSKNAPQNVCSNLNNYISKFNFWQYVIVLMTGSAATTNLCVFTDITKHVLCIALIRKL